MLYHVSKTAGLKVLEPHVSTHGKAWVYAIEDQVTGALFGAEHDDFDLMLSGEGGLPEVWECYPGAFEKIYKGKDCSVYEVSEEGFVRGMTPWELELVCEKPVPVVRETAISDLHGWLRSAAEQGQLELHRYEFSPAYRAKVADHVADRIFRFELDLKDCMARDERFATHYRALSEALLSAVDGHLLA